MTSDYLAMQSLVQRLCTPESRWHVGDIGWSFASGNLERRRIRVWRDGDTVISAGWLDLSGHLEVLADPAYPGASAEVLAWADTIAPPEATRTAAALETERHISGQLLAAGYVEDTDAPYFTHHHVDLDAIDEPVVPQGFRVRHVQPGEAAMRAAVHRGSWSDFGPSKVTTEVYANVMNSWPYRPEFDWIVETDEGEAVASSLGWLDEVNGVGLLEPVGCVPEYRRRGLSRACNLAVLHAFRNAGATTGRVCPRGDDGYPIPGKLYRAIGFRPGARTVTYIRPS